MDEVEFGLPPESILCIHKITIYRPTERVTHQPQTTWTYPKSTTSYTRKPTRARHSTRVYPTKEAFPTSMRPRTVSYHGDDESVDDHKEHDDKHTVPKLNKPSLPNICDGHIDAIATLRSELFVFRDKVNISVLI